MNITYECPECGCAGTFEELDEDMSCCAELIMNIDIEECEL